MKFIYFNFNVNTNKFIMVQMPFTPIGRNYLYCNNIIYFILKMPSTLLHSLYYFNYYAINFTMW